MQSRVDSLDFRVRDRETGRGIAIVLKNLFQVVEHVHVLCILAVPQVANSPRITREFDEPVCSRFKIPEQILHWNSSA